MVRSDLKFVAIDAIIEVGITRREFINSAHIQRIYVNDKFVNMELTNGVILTLNASNIDTVIEKFYL